MDACCTPIFSSTVSPDDAELLAGRLKALADPNRLRLLSLIAACGEVCACDPVDALGLSQPTVSHHLGVLTEAGILERERRGRWIHYRVADDGVTAILDALRVPAQASATSSSSDSSK
jgi:ArsR family transcriptional regulator